MRSLFSLWRPEIHFGHLNSMTAPPAIEIDHLTVSFTNKDVTKYAVKNVSLQVPSGSSFVIVGETGSGKSTLVKAMLGLLPELAHVEEGRMFLNGESLPVKDDPRWLKYRGRVIAVILQNPGLALNPTRSCGLQIVEVYRYVVGQSKTDAASSTRDLLAKVGFQDIDRIFKSYPHQLSGGQQQRICIAMALAAGCQVLIADEPTSALDSLLKAELLALLKDLQQSLGFTFILVTHDLQLAMAISPEWHVMYQGEVVYSGRMDQEGDEHPYVRNLKRSFTQLSQAAVARRVSQPYIFQLRNISFSYNRGAKVLKGITLDLMQGQRIGLLGASGAGKSTLAKILAGLECGYDGNALYKGEEIADSVRSNPRKYFGNVQYLLQDSSTAMPPHLTVGEILSDTLQAFSRLSVLDRRARGIEILNYVGLEVNFMDKKRNEMSGGEKQRVAIARALAADPELLILDESLSALDKSVQLKMVELLISLQNALGLTLIVVAHDVALLTHFCDSLVILHEGIIVAQGTVGELMKEGPETYVGRLLKINL